MKQWICPACDSKDIRVKYKIIFGLKSLMKCRKCGLCFILPKSPSDVNYAKDYYRSWFMTELGEEGAVLIKRATSNYLLSIIESYKNKGSLLDIGCAFGYLLDVACERGWKCWGIDISEYASQVAAENNRIEKIWIGDFLNISMPKEKFNVIVMVDFVEHIYNTKDVLIKCKKMLNNKGLLVVVTPDSGSFSCKCMGRHWPHFNNEHVTYFSRKCAETIFDILGFNLLKVAGFKKVLNLCYFESQIRAHGSGLLIFLINILFSFVPPRFKRINFFMPHGEMLIVAQKR